MTVYNQGKLNDVEFFGIEGPFFPFLKLGVLCFIGREPLVGHSNVALGHLRACRYRTRPGAT